VKAACPESDNAATSKAAVPFEEKFFWRDHALTNQPLVAGNAA